MNTTAMRRTRSTVDAAAGELRNSGWACGAARWTPYRVRVDTQLAIARSFIDAVQAKNDRAAAELCSNEIEVLLPGAGTPLKGKDGVRQMIDLAPKLEQSARGEVQRGDEVRISTLTRAPGVFANYTTWVFVFEGNKIRRLSFELRAAN